MAKIKKSKTDPIGTNGMITLDEFNSIESSTTNKSGSVNVTDYDEQLKQTGEVKQGGYDRTGEYAANQGFLDNTVNVAVGGTINFVAGVLDGFNYDVPDMIDMASGVEKEYGNWLSRITDDMRENVSKDYPIYTHGDLWDGAYWASQAQNVAYSVGLIGQSFVEQALLSAGTAATLGGAAPIQAASAASKVSKISKALSSFKNLASGSNKARTIGNASYGMLKGVHEGYINGLETYNNTYKEVISRGLGKDEAVKIASQAASKGYKMEMMPLMLLNGMQWGLLAKANPFKKTVGKMDTGFGSLLSKPLEKLTGKIGNKNLNTLSQYGVQMASEGLEEGIQTGIGKYATHKSLSDNNLEFSRFDLWEGHEMRDSIIGGMFGATVFKGGGDYLQRKGNKKREANYEKNIEKFMSSLKETTQVNADALQKAIVSGDKNEIRRIRNKVHKDNTFRSLELDSIKGDGEMTVFNSHIEGLREIRDAAKSGDQATLDKYGVNTKEDIINIVENYDKFIADAEFIKEKTIKHYESTGDYYISATIADHEISFKENSENLSDVKSEIKNIKDILEQDKDEESPEFGKLSPIDKAEYVQDLKVLTLNNNVLTSDKEAITKNLKYLSDKANIRKMIKAKAKNKVKNAETKEEVEKVIEENKDNTEVLEEAKNKLNEVEVNNIRSTEPEVFNPYEGGMEIDESNMEGLQALGFDIRDLNKEYEAVPESAIPENLFDPSIDKIGGIVDKISRHLLQAKNIKFPEKNQIVAVARSIGANNQLINDIGKYIDNSLLGEITSDILEANAEYNSQNENVNTGENKETVEVEGEKVTVVHEGVKRSHSNSTLAILHREYETVKSIDQYGNTIYNKVSKNNEIIKSDAYNLNTYDPDKLNPGTKLNIKLAEDTDNTLVSVWDDNFEKTAIPFKDWVRIYNDGKVEDEAWWNKVPMVIWEDGETKPTSTIHDTDWANPSNIQNIGERSAEDIIKEAKENVGKIRSQVKDNGEITVSVTKKNKGNYILSDTYIPIVDNFDGDESQVILGIIDDNGAIIDVKTGKVFEGALVNDLVAQKAAEGKYATGATVELRRGVNKGEFHATWAKPKELASSSIFNTLKAFINYKYNGETKNQKHFKNINTHDEVEQFLSRFFKLRTQKGLTVENTGKNNEIDIIKRIANKTRFNSKDPFSAIGAPFIIREKGKIYFGRVRDFNSSPANEIQTYLNRLLKEKGKESFKESFQDTQDFFGIHVLKADNVDNFLNFFSQGEILDNQGSDFTTNTVQNVSNIQGEIPMFDNDGNYSGDSSYYSELIKNVETKVKAHNIGTKENPNFITLIQPNIEFESVNDEINLSEVETSPVVEESVPQTSSQAEILESLGLLEEEKAEMERVDSLMEESEEGVIAVSTLMTDVLKKAMVESVTGIEGLGVLEEYQTVRYLYNQYSLAHQENSKFDNGVVGEFKTKLEKKRKEYSDRAFNLKDSGADTKSVKYFEDQVSKIDTVLNNIGKIDASAKEVLAKYLKLEEIYGRSEDNNEQGKRFGAVNASGSKKQGSILLKRFYSGVKAVDTNNNPLLGFLDLPIYVGYDEVSDTIIDILTSPSEVNPTLEDMIARLRPYITARPYLKNIIAKLEDHKTSSQLKQTFVTENTKHNFLSSFVMYSTNQDGSKNVLKTYYTNANEVTRVIRDNWESNLYNANNLIYFSGETNNYKVNTSAAERSLLSLGEGVIDRSEFPTLKAYVDAVAIQAQSGNISDKNIHDFLSSYGITISKETLTELKNKGMYVRTEAVKEEYVSYNNMWRPSSKTHGIFGLMLNNLLDMAGETSDFSLGENSENHPYEGFKPMLKKLSKIESKYAHLTSVTSFRDGDKTISSKPLGKFATESANKLATDQAYRDQFRSKSFSENSMMLDLLDNNSHFRKSFKILHTSLSAIKQLASKDKSKSGVNDLSVPDYNTLEFGYFQDLEKIVLDATVGDNIPLRVARMLFPTMSDKSQMLLIDAATLDLKNLMSITDVGVKLDTKVYEYLREQLVDNEVNRIFEAARIGKTNIEGYDVGSSLFMQLPSMNLVEYKGKTLYDLFNVGKFKDGYSFSKYRDDMASLEKNTEFREFLKTQGTKKVSQMISTENTKLAKEMVKDYMDADGNIKILDSNYLERFQGENIDKIKMAAIEFTVNKALTLANINMLFSGDPAMYNKTKGLIKDKNDIIPQIKNKSFTNLGKRLGLLLAPRKKGAGSNGKTYKQIFMSDYISVSENIKEIVSQLDNKIITDEEISVLKEGNGVNPSNEIKNAVSIIKNKYPKSQDFFSLEGSDAQEYTTAYEHLGVLQRQGYISDELFIKTMDKIDAQNQFLKENPGELIPKDLYITEGLEVILQPLKPVHTGFKNDPSSNTMRMMYIKSSSFPLLPQTTQGFELDKLRLMLEKIEKGTGTEMITLKDNRKVSIPKQGVRASYSTANKVGALNNPISVFDTNNNFNTKLSTEDFQKSTMDLDRGNFGIQQDNPVKFLKGKKDQVTIGSQSLKILMGDGISSIKSINHNGKDITGRELIDDFNKINIAYTDHKKKLLLEEFYLDDNFKSFDPEKTAKTLQDFLQKEAKERGMAQQDVKSLEMELNGDSYRFKIPVWLTSNSNSYESLLNAVIDKRLNKYKFPGTSFILGSEAGFKRSGNGGNVIYTSSYDFEKGQLQGAKVKEGKTQLTQVFLPSRFRDNKGKIIEFFLGDNTPNPKYTKEVNGNIMLDETKIPKELLQKTSFRVPTSSHVSLTQIEVVGVLPPTMGDLMILPSNLTIQKGIDFDIDKETTYQHHTFMDIEGNLVRLTKDNQKEYFDILMSENDKHDKSVTDLMWGIFGEEGLEGRESLVFGRIKEAVMENEILDFYSTILTAPSLQPKINSILSIEFAKTQAEIIDNIISEKEDISNWSPLTSTFQRSKMNAASIGKLGIGVYSNMLVLNSMINASEGINRLVTRKGKEISINIGGIKSDGILGKTFTLDESRSIAEMFAELQNIATDNEKEQVMGKVGINKYTINAQTMMAALGFDKVKVDGKEHSLQFMMMSHPIIKEYVRRISNENSKIKAYNPDAKTDIIRSLLGVDTYKELGVAKGLRESLDGNYFFNSLSGTNIGSDQSKAVLHLFLELDEHAQNLQEFQRYISTSPKGLGKSAFDTYDKYNFVKNGANVKGISNLGDLIFKYENPTGNMLKQSAEVGYGLLKDFFPYENPVLNEVFNEIKLVIEDDKTSGKKRIENKQHILQEFKKYLYTSSSLGIVGNNTQAERHRLVVKDASKDSLSSYLQKVLNLKKYDFFKKNPLISRFSYKVNRPGTFSTLNYDNTTEEDFDEELLYNSLPALLDENRSLPKFNGENYSTDKLVEDLIKYSYLQGGIQKATEFVKYIPVSFLENIAFKDVSNKWNDIFNSDVAKDPKILEIINTFKEQYFQHNPDKLPKHSFSKEDNVNVGKINTISIDSTEKYLAVRDNFAPKGTPKNIVLKEVGLGEYQRISNLGSSGFSEYQMLQRDTKSIINSNFSVKTKAQKISKILPEVTENMGITRKGNKLNEVIDNLGENKYTDILKFLKDNDLLSNINVKSDNIKPNGSYNTVDKEITISDKILRGNPEEISKVVLKEVIHSVTVHEMIKYMDKDGKLNQEGSSNPVMVSLNRIYNQYKTELIEEIGQEKFDSFIENGFTSQEDKIKVYPATNIFEFVEVAFTEEGFQEILKGKKYLASGKTFNQKLMDLLSRLFNTVTGADTNTQVLNDIFTIIKDNSKSDNSGSTPQNLNDIALNYSNLLQKINKEAGINPNKSEIKALSLPDNIKPCK